MLQQVNHAVMAVDSVEANRVFYTQALGLAEIDADAVVCLRIGPTILELQDDDSNAAAVAQPSIDHFALNVSSIDETYDALKAKVGFRAPPHTTEVGHRNMQRALLAFEAPGGFTYQIAETVDPRDHLEARRRAKDEMASGVEGIFRGLDHISTYCTNFAATRAFYADKLGLEEFFYSNTREEGEAVASGFEQAAFAVGGTDIELASDENWDNVQPGRIRMLGFATDDVDQMYSQVKERGAQPAGEPTEGTIYGGIARFFELLDPNGLTIRISQAL